MWTKAYKDYPKDTDLKKEQVEPGQGIIGCEMHEMNGWGEMYHIPKAQKKGFFRLLIESIFGQKK